MYLYKKCDSLIFEANNLYNDVKQIKGLNRDYKNFIDSMYIFINKYDEYREDYIKQYILDLKEELYKKK